MHHTMQHEPVDSGGLLSHAHDVLHVQVALVAVHRVDVGVVVGHFAVGGVEAEGVQRGLEEVCKSGMK